LVWTFLKHAKLILPARTVEAASVAVLTLGAAVFVPIKTGLALHEYFKGAVFAAGEVQSGCTSFLDFGRKKRRRLFSKSTASAYAKRDAALR
jgi:hypothetical protein